MDSTQILQLYMTIWLALLGAVMGSFLDCMAMRGGLPKGRSHCDACHHVLSPMDLLPILGYLLHKGRCRYCGAKIPLRCLVTEVVGAVLFASLGLKFGLHLELVMQLILGGLLLLLACIDWDSHILPDRLLLVAGINRLVFVFLLGQPLSKTLLSMLIGGLSVSLPLLILSLVMDHVLQKESMGGGDIKLLFVLGLYLHWLEMLLLLFVGCVLALAWALRAKKNNTVAEIPFGPFLAVAWWIVVLFGASWIQWYQGLLV